MSTLHSFIDRTSDRGSAFAGALASSDLHERTPAAFAQTAYEGTSPRYVFLSTACVLETLAQAGFLPVAAAQTRTSEERRLHARHAIRLRRRYEYVALKDTIPELLLVNGHDGRTATQLRVALFRVVCTNGLIVSMGDLSVWRFPHRGAILDDVAQAALAQAELFSEVGANVERMERTVLEEPQRLEFAERALALRYPEGRQGGMHPSQLLAVRREADVGHDLWRTYNCVQENLLKGGLTRRSPSNRLTQTRAITAIKEGIRLNTALWEMAMALAA